MGKRPPVQIAEPLPVSNGRCRGCGATVQGSTCAYCGSGQGQRSQRAIRLDGPLPKIWPDPVELPDPESLSTQCRTCGGWRVKGWCETCQTLEFGGERSRWARFRCRHRWVPIEAVPSNWEDSSRTLPINARAFCVDCGKRSRVGCHRMAHVPDSLVGMLTVVFR